LQKAPLDVSSEDTQIRPEFKKNMPNSFYVYKLLIVHINDAQLFFLLILIRVGGTLMGKSGFFCRIPLSAE
jgi:hypothetical protein